jgi:hypothetical protein
MKTWFTSVWASGGLIYGLWAVLLVYREAPLNLQCFIVGAVAVVGASVGWMLGLIFSSFAKMSREAVRRSL